MPIQIACPSCNRQLRVPDNLIGQLVKCPGCEKTFTASVEERAPAPKESHQEEAPSREREEDSYKAAERPPRPPRRDLDDDDDEDFDRDRDRPRRRRRSSRNYTPHRGTLILVLGILALTGFGIFTGIPAWIMGNNDMNEIRAGRMDPEGESNTNIGRILGMVGTLVHAIPLLLGGCFCCLALTGGLAGKR